MTKVYCNNCKYHPKGKSNESLISGLCHHPSLFHKVEYKKWEKPNQYIIQRKYESWFGLDISHKMKDKNSNNKCKDYEAK